ncbi:hypothetical protein B4N89_27290 [Embleya scabrispora]|uniref:Uncharacterized protein n=1 Tax=Embleya scabrispora TaxID=159449 RepID=A0A1T3P4X9_9ACTN|nr:hypothetical protein [Embleya scabrispora]OPC84136.1 hypothetical protein B4N89_27290 [Embleya scabrispora]
MSIDNTSNLDPTIAYGMLLAARSAEPTISAVSTAFITDMEAQGQRQLVASDLLPTECDDDATLEALGITLGEPLADDPLFRPATLPDGWSREASTHDMHSHILDEHGRRRVHVFYKAAFYDRKAWMGAESVFSYVTHCVGRHVKPIPDDAWATPEALHDAANQAAERWARLARTARSHGAADEAREYDTERTAYLAIAERFAPSGGAA